MFTRKPFRINTYKIANKCCFYTTYK